MAQRITLPGNSYFWRTALQSINEELTTAKEELESSNEELTTINDELATRNQELNRLNSDLNNLHQSINTPILVLGRDLTIRRFTALAGKVFSLLATDLGRPLTNIRHNLVFPGLEKLVRETIDAISPREQEVQDTAGNWYVLRVRPYLTVENQIDGAVLVLVDINVLKETERKIREARDFAEAVVQAVPPLLILEPNLRVRLANEAFYATFGLTPRQTGKRLIYTLGKGQWNLPELHTLLEEVLPRNGAFKQQEVTHKFKTIGQRTLLLTGRRADHSQVILLSIQDISARKRAEQLLSGTQMELQAANTALRDTNSQLEQRLIQLQALAGEIERSKEDERRRIAKILHNDVQQLMFGARVHIETLCANSGSKALRNDLQRVGTLIEDAIEVSRNLSYELNPVVLQKSGLIAALRWLARSMHDIHGLTVHIKARTVIEPEDENTKTALYQAVSELLFNVVKHAGVKQARMEIARSRDNEFEIFVSDQGRGFDPAIFKWHRMARTGLGSSSLRERLELFGARMEVVSAPGRGSRFRIIAPLSQAAAKGGLVIESALLPAPPVQPLKPAVLPGASATASHARVRVLLADDHEIVREGLASMLRKEPLIEVVGVASDGMDAISQVRNFQPDLVLMDLDMPVMDGVEAARRITAMWPRIKVIGLSMYSDSHRQRAMRAAGAVNSVGKKGRPTDLIRLILKTASRGRSSAKPA